MRRFHLLFRASPVQTIIETCVLSLLAWFLCYLLLKSTFKVNIPIGQLIFVVGALGIPWCALRLSRVQTLWWVRRLREAAVVEILCVAQSIVVTMSNVVHLSLFENLPTIVQNFLVPTSRVFVISLFLFFCNFSIFLVIRVIGRLWDIWNYLRRTRLQWSLTHAHAMVVAFGTLLLMIMATILLVISARESFARMLIPIFIVVIIVGVLAILAVIPPSALFSYVVVRGTVQRLQVLTKATSALRAGNYAVRVPVSGEDEVAQLQVDFNAMATDLERVMRELQQERDTVASLLQSRRELVANASHELRTPVATLRSYLETTLTHWHEHRGPELQQDLLVMESEVLHLQTLVEDLFALARADIGRLSLRYEPTDLGLLVYHLVDVSAPLAWQASKVEVVCDVREHLPYALVDRMRVEQLLQSLLHSAVRDTAPGGFVIIVVGLENDKLLIQVKNTGKGFVSEDLLSIGERSYPDASRNFLSPEQNMAGLGLVLVKEWTEAMGGQIAVENNLEEGSCFYIRFPMLEEIEPRPGALSEEAASAPGLSISLTR